MKIGVISSYACIRTANNYGALLQYYALQEYLKIRGHDVFWIRSILPQSCLHIFMRHLKNYKSLKLVHDFYICHNTFMDFQKKFLNVTTREYKGNNDLSNNCPLADFYITGSDQVWGSTLKENYLRFVKDSSKKIAYAASFGQATLPDEQLRTIAPWVRSIDYISVREYSGLKICRQLGIEAIHLLDPTLLLDRKEYTQIIPSFLKDTLKKTDPICFSYFINIQSLGDIHFEKITEYAKNKNLKLVIASAQYSEPFFHRSHLIYPSPEEWLAHYNHAECVFTNTYHGTVFALIFHKPFITILQKGNSSSQNVRILSLLHDFNLENRIWREKDDLNEIMNQKIDWPSFEIILSEKREKTDVFFNQIKL